MSVPSERGFGRLCPPRSSLSCLERSSGETPGLGNLRDNGTLCSGSQRPGSRAVALPWDGLGVERPDRRGHPRPRSPGDRTAPSAQASLAGRRHLVFPTLRCQERIIKQFLGQAPTLQPGKTASRRLSFSPGSRDSPHQVAEPQTHSRHLTTQPPPPHGQPGTSGRRGTAHWSGPDHVTGACCHPPSGCADVTAPLALIGRLGDT